MGRAGATRDVRLGYRQSYDFETELYGEENNEDEIGASADGAMRSHVNE